MSETTTTDRTSLVVTLSRIGARWQKNGMDRIYINDLPRWYGLECSYYNSGNVSSAKLDGQDVSNGRAKTILSDLSYCKIWYDVPTGQWWHRWTVTPRYDVGDYERTIIGRVMTSVAPS